MKYDIIIICIIIIYDQGLIQEFWFVGGGDNIILLCLSVRRELDM